MPSDEKEITPTLGEAIGRLASAMLRLAPAELARLRRMQADGPGELIFWKLAISCGLRTDDKGMELVRIMAILAPKGEPGSRTQFHNFEQSFGTKLAETQYSEKRLSRFLELQFEERAEALERMARWLRARGGTPVNCRDIACLLFSGDVKYARTLAESYYREFDKDPKKDAAA